MKQWIPCMAVMAAMVSFPASADDAAPPKSNTLVVYYSYSGNTELVATTLADSIKADVLEIEDARRPSEDEAYTAGRNAATQGAAWPVKPFNQDLSGYDRIFIGYPVWYGMPPPAINAFIEQVDLHDKRVVVFVTMNSGGHNRAIRAMTEKISARGGTVAASFSVRAGAVTPDDIVNQTRGIASQYQNKAPTEELRN